MGEEDDADDRFPPQMTRGEVALWVSLLLLAAVAAVTIDVIAVLFDRP